MNNSNSIEVKGSIIDPNRPNIVKIGKEFESVNTSSLPKNFKFVLSDLGTSTILHMENIGDKVRVCIKGYDDYSYNEYTGCTSPFIYNKVKNELLLSYKKKNPIVLLVNSPESKKSIFIYSIDLEHSSIIKIWESCIDFDWNLINRTQDTFEQPLSNIKRKVFLQQRRNENELYGSCQKMVIPSPELNSLLVINRKGLSRKYNPEGIIWKN